MPGPNCQYCAYGTVLSKPFETDKPADAIRFQKYASCHVQCCGPNVVKSPLLKPEDENFQCPDFAARTDLPTSSRPLQFPGFRYYKLDREYVALDGNGGIVPMGPIQEERSMHSDILNAAMKLFRSENKSGWTRAMIWSWYNYLPDYFLTVPASATGKYHPSWANRPDGLLLHSLAVTRNAALLSDLMPDLKDWEYNALIFAAWHHDMFKYGNLDKYTGIEMTVHEHPVLGGEFFLLDKVRAELKSFNIDPEQLDLVSDLISTHAGPYRSSHFSSLKLPECRNPINILLYKSDYLASRKENDPVKDVLAEIPEGGL